MATIADTIRKALTEGKSNEQVLVDVKAAHPESQTTAACVSYYRSKMKKASPLVAAAKVDKKIESKKVVEVTNSLDQAIAAYSVIKVKSFMGREGHGFNATLCRGGKAVAFVWDDASGGPTSFDWIDRAEEKALLDLCSTMPSITHFGVSLDISPCMFAEQLVNNFLLLKEIAKLTKGKIAYISKLGKLYTMPWGYRTTEEVIALVKSKHEGCTILNGLSDAEAMAAVRAIQR